MGKSDASTALMELTLWSERKDKMLRWNMGVGDDLERVAEEAHPGI